MRAQDDLSLPALAGLAETLRRATDLRGRFEAIRRCARTVREIAARSYWHPNGFAKLVLHDEGTRGLRVRLHVWPVATDEHAVRGDSNAHGHRWEFASAVIVGAGLQVEHYARHPEGAEYEHLRFAAGGTMRSVGRERLVATTRRFRPLDDLYVCDTDVVHRIDPRGDDVVATLLVQGPDLLAETSVYRVPDRPVDPPNAPVTTTDVEDLLDTVTARL